MVRQYQPDDAAALWELKRGFELGLGDGSGDEEKATRYEEKLTEQYREDYLDWVGRCIGEEKQAVQIAEREGSVVGYVFVLPETYAHIWDGAVINELYVKPDYRGEGIGDELLEVALNVAQSQSLPLDRVLLDVDEENGPARALYEKHGFDHWGEMLSRPL